MKRWKLTSALILVAAAMCGVARMSHGEPAASAWLTDLRAAQEQARRDGKPLLVLFRCARRVACPELDAALEQPSEAEMTELLTRFVPVRLSDVRTLDLARFRFDYDLNFAVLMMNAEGHTYSRFGTRDAEHSWERMSVAGLKRAMREVLAEYAKQPHAAPPSGAPVRLADNPAYQRNSLAKQPCAHCHYVKNFGFFEEMAKGAFTRRKLYEYPLPENLGVTLEVDRNNVIQSVLPGSPAAKAGVMAGDVIHRAGATSIHTAADLQFALNDVPEPGSAALELERGGKRLKPVTLKLPFGWRETDISWRTGQASVPPIFGFWEQALTPEEKAKLGVRPDRLALRVTTLFQGEKWEKAHGDVRMGDVIVAMDGEELPQMTPRQFHVRYRLRHNPGETVTLTIIRNGERKNLTLECVDLRVE